jgi:hypothetical protein
MIITRFKKRLWKKFSLDVENIVEERYINDVDIQELYHFIGVLAPEHKNIATPDDIRDASGPTIRKQPAYANPPSPLDIPFSFFVEQMVTNTLRLTADSSDDKDDFSQSGDDTPSW